MSYRPDKKVLENPSGQRLWMAHIEKLKAEMQAARIKLLGIAAQLIEEGKDASKYQRGAAHIKNGIKNLNLLAYGEPSEE